MRHFAIDLGSVMFPAARYAAFLMTWVGFGSLAALLFAFGIARLALREGAADGFAHDFAGRSDRRFMIACGLLAFGLSAAISQGVLRGARLTDDEAAYQ